MRFFPRLLRQWTAVLLVAHFVTLHAVPAAAGLMPSRVSGATALESVRDADWLVIQRALEHKVVVQKLRDYGVSVEEARARLQHLSDAELHQLASVAHGLPSGSDGLGTLVAVLVIIILVIVILKLLNKEIVIK
jgi:hypothetical protein